jgi:hypothetical protein
VVIGEVASLAHALGVKKSVMVLTVSSIVVSTELSIAGGAHVLGIVLSVWMWALSDLHNVVFNSTLFIIYTIFVVSLFLYVDWRVLFSIGFHIMDLVRI